MFNDKYGLTEAVLNGSKTMTRRIYECPNTWNGINVTGFRKATNCEGDYFTYLVDENEREIEGSYMKPKYEVGEIVAIAQNYETISKEFGNECLPLNAKNNQGWHNKMFVRADLMPHRIQIINIQIECLRDISNEDCFKEGIYKGQCGSKETHFMDAYYFKGEIQPYCTPRDAYSILIERIFDEYTWDQNPYVFVYEFKLIK